MINSMDQKTAQFPYTQSKSKCYLQLLRAIDLGGLEKYSKIAAIDSNIISLTSINNTMISTQIDEDRARRQRLGGHLQYSLSDSFIGYITVQDSRLYFQKYNTHVTISDLNEQFAQQNEGRQLVLKTESFQIDSTMPLAEITSTPEKIQVLEKVLKNVVQHKDPVLEIQKPEQKKVADEILSFVKKHNEKVETTKEFQSHQCLIQLRERPQCKSPFTYFVTQTTTINQIAEKIDQEAGNHVNLVRVQTSNNIASSITYSQNQYTKPFSQLRMNSKQLIFSYPPVLTMSSPGRFKVKLTNSFYPKQTVQLKVKKQDTILVVLKTIKALTKNQNDPLEIRDSQKNIIGQNRWKEPLGSFVYRQFSLQFVYPTFLSYDCKIMLLNHPGKPLTIIFPIQKQTSFNHIIDYVRQQIRCVNAHFRIQDAKGKSYGSQLRNKSLFSLQIEEAFFKFVFIKPTCLISSKAKIMIQSQGLEDYQEIEVKQLTQMENFNQIKVLCYNQEKHQMELGNISCFRKQNGFSRFFQVQLAGDVQLVTLQCFQDSTFITENFEWKPARMLVKGEKVMMLRDDLQTVHYAEVIGLKQIGFDQQEQVFTLQVLPFHNFLANRVIMHNDQGLTILAHFFSQNQPVKKQKLNCFIYDKLVDIKAFKNKKVMLGGLTLNTNQTFGDYQIYNFGTLFVFDENYKENSKEFIISEWREESYSYEDVNVMLKNKWTTDCLGLRESKIVQLKQSELNSKNSNRPEHLLVTPKINLEKLHYIYNIAPEYKRYSENTLNKVFKPQLDSNQGLKKKFEEIAGNQDSILKSQLEILPVYLYTTNIFYKELNQFLRLFDKNISLQEFKKWYSLTSSLINSLEKLPSVEYKTLYRGISNISIKDAFSRRQNKDKQSYLILNSFISTTTAKEVAQSFILGRGALVTIKTSSGKSIKNYSQYSEEQEILLPPYLYFRITKFQPEKDIQEIELQEIPFPKTTRNKLIFWVDDMPANNTAAIEQHFDTSDIEVVQVVSTSLMKILLRDFFGILQAMGKKIVIISDMTRYQDGQWNTQAGVDLFNLIYKEYGMSNKAIIFTMDKNRALNAIQQRGINPGKWSVHVTTQNVVEEVMAEFNRKL